MKLKPRIYFRCENEIAGLVVTDDWYQLEEKIEEQLKTFKDPDTFYNNKSENIAISFINRAENLIEKTPSTIALLAELRERSQYPESWRLILQTIKLIILALRAGYIPGMAQVTVKEKRRQSSKGSLPRTRNGMTPDERRIRDAQILADYGRSRLNKSAFMAYHMKRQTYKKGDGYLSGSGILKVLNRATK